MEKMIVHGGKRLAGRIGVSGAKNAVLPIIAATILGQTKSSCISKVPALHDVNTMMEVLKSLNIKLSVKNDALYVDASNDLKTEAPYEYVRKMRASVLVMGPLLARKGQAKIALPGGCAIGTRPIDLHLKGFEALGADINFGNGFVEARAVKRLQGAYIYLDIPSVGATENLMMAATLAEGRTTLENAAEEPEIVDLAQFLNKMGAQIQGAGTSTITIDGVKNLNGANHSVMPDRIEAGTHIIAAAITKSNVFVEGATSDHLNPLISKLREMGIPLVVTQTGVQVNAKDCQYVGVDVQTMPYPGFPTDLQPQMMALLLTADGTSIVTETVFENRFMHVDECIKMNAQIKTQGRSAFIEGGTTLKGTKVKATDLRAGAALVLAGLVAEGTTEISGLEHIDRGYDNIVGKLISIGADIRRLNAQGESVAVEDNMSTLQLKLSQPSLA